MSSNLNKIEEIGDIEECVKVMKAVGLLTKGFNGMDEMKTALCKHLKELEGTSTPKVSKYPATNLLYTLVSRYQLIVAVILSKCCVVR